MNINPNDAVKEDEILIELDKRTVYFISFNNQKESQ